MPLGKSKEDTWKAADLKKSINDSKDERKRHKDNDRHRDKDREKERDKHRDKERDRHHDKERDKERDRHHDKDRDRDKHRDRDRDRDKEHRRDKERHRDDDHKERRQRDKDGEKIRHRDKERNDKHRREDGEHRRHRDEKGHHSKHRDEDGHHRDKDEKRHHRDRDEEKRHRDRDDDKSQRHRDKDEDDKRRHRKHEEEKKQREKKEKERLEKERKEKEQAEEEYDYEDDFEDYDDDFEDDEDDDDVDDADGDKNDTASYNSTEYRSKGKQFSSDMDEILDAMNKENERLLVESQRSNWSEENEEKPKKQQVMSTTPTFINFVSAKQRQMSKKAMGKAAQRGYELQQMIEFDVTEYDIFDMPPVTEYTIYMRSFGSSNTRQAYIQTNEDNIDRDIQTEDIEYREKWTQQPPSEIISCGDPNDNKDADDSQPIDMPRLASFVDKAAQVMTTLLEEDFLDILETEQNRSKQSNIIISDAFTEITIPQFLNGRPVITSYFSPVQTHMLLTLHATPTKSSYYPLSRQGCICVWNVNDPDQPQQILMCESRPHCCCFSPTKTNLVFSGMEDGSVVAWDTKEPSSLHRYHKLDNTSWLLRYPTYNTAGVLHYENHQSPVVAINTITAPGESASGSLGQANSEGGLSFQLATLEQNGVIHLWVVAELSHSDLAGSESDYGLAPGGRIKLVKSSAIQLESPLKDTELRTTMKCTDMQLLPSNNSHYYVASDTGCIIHGLRYGGKAPPRAYRPAVENLVQVTSIDFSPFHEPVFLAGCEDGALRLYHTNNEWPLVSWLMSTEGRPIRLVRWCRSRPAVFFVLDSASRLYIWDLLMEDGGPLNQEVISEHGVTSLSLSNDYSATGQGLPGRRPQMVIGLENGCCEIHTMSQQLSALMPDELDQFAAFLQRTS